MSDKYKQKQKDTQITKEKRGYQKKDKDHAIRGALSHASQGQTQKQRQTLRKESERMEQRDLDESNSDDDFQSTKDRNSRRFSGRMEKSQNVEFNSNKKCKQEVPEARMVQTEKNRLKSSVQLIPRNKPRITKIEKVPSGLFKRFKLRHNNEVTTSTKNRKRTEPNEQNSSHINRSFANNMRNHANNTQSTLSAAASSVHKDENIPSSTVKEKKKRKKSIFSIENFIVDRSKNDESESEIHDEDEPFDSVEPASINEIPPSLLLSFNSMSLSQEIRDEFNGPTRELRKEMKKNYNERGEDDESVTESSYSPSEEECSSGDEDVNFGKRNLRKRKNSGISHSPPKKRLRRYMKSNSSAVRLRRKEARLSGQSFKTVSGKTMRARQRRELTPCRMKCAERISDKQCESLHREFYQKLTNVDSQRRHLAAYISVIPKKTTRVSTCTPSRKRERQHTLKYFVSINGSSKKICKGCFQKIYDVSNTVIDTIVKKKTENEAGIPTRDQRGRHEPTRKISPKTLRLIKAHLLSFPSYQSHYDRKNMNKRILPSHYNLTILYELYCKKYPDNKVSRWIYDREFRKLKLTFKKPKVDTCKTCDKLQKQLEQAETEFEKSHISEEVTHHQNMAAAIYQAKSHDKKLAKMSNEKMVTATYDLQQCLPTPSLSTSEVFYARQLWTYNLTCHNCNNGKSHNFMWHEAIAPRGANQIASGIFNFLIELPDTVEKVIFYSDSCAGQNKNFIISAMYMCALQQKSTLKCIEHKFLLPGHTRNECDSDHSAIERAKKKVQHINWPMDYYNMIRNMGKRYEVTVMSNEHQFDFSKLLDSALKRPKTNTLGDKFLLRPVHWMRYHRSTLGLIQYKDTVDENTKFLMLDMRRNRNVPKFKVSRLRGPHPISKEKKDSLIKLLKYIDKDVHDFYNDLVTDKNAADYYDDSSSTEDEHSDSEELHRS